MLCSRSYKFVRVSVRTGVPTPGPGLGGPEQQGLLIYRPVFTKYGALLWERPQGAVQGTLLAGGPGQTDSLRGPSLCTQHIHLDFL